MSPDSIPTPSRRRGAPLGNHNATKHGFYAEKFRSEEQLDLAQSELTNLDDEITLMRVHIRRVIELNEGQTTLKNQLEILRVICLASLTINRLLRTQTMFTLPPQVGSPAFSPSMPGPPFSLAETLQHLQDLLPAGEDDQPQQPD